MIKRYLSIFRLFLLLLIHQKKLAQIEEGLKISDYSPKYYTLLASYQILYLYFFKTSVKEAEKDFGDISKILK